MWTKPWTFKEGFLIGGGSRTERHHQGDAAGHRTETLHHGDLRRWQSQTLCLRDPVCMFVAFFSFILSMWISLERPPLRTMGETRLWYSFFLPLAGITVYSRWKYKWILTFSTILALVFIPGGTTGRGIPRRHGRPSPGWPTLSTCTIVTFPIIVSAWLSGCSSSLSSYCRCAGGASTICPLHKAPAYTPIAWADKLSQPTAILVIHYDYLSRITNK